MAASSRSSGKSLSSPFSSLAGQSLPLVKCDCCGWRRAVRLVSQSEANPDRVFFKCSNHRRGGPNAHPGSDFCDFYYWIEEYVELLLQKGVEVSSSSLDELVMLGCELMPLTKQALNKKCNNQELQLGNLQKQGREEKKHRSIEEASILLEIKQQLKQLVEIAERILYVCVLILLVCLYVGWKK